MDDNSRQYFGGIIFSESHGAFGSHLGAGALYYALGVMLQARVSVCIGSGGGFVPRLMRKAQRDVGLENACTYLIDANLAELGFGHPMQPGGWLTPENDLQGSDKDLVVLQVLSRDAASLFGAAGIEIDYLHIDGDHSAAGVLREFEDYLPLLSVNSVITMHDLRLESVRLALAEIAAKHPELERIVFDEVGQGTAVLRLREDALRRRLPETAESLRNSDRPTRIPDSVMAPAIAPSQMRARYERWHYLATSAYQVRYEIVAKAIDAAGRTVVELGGFPNSIVTHLSASRRIVAIEPYAPPDFVARIQTAAKEREAELLILSRAVAAVHFAATASKPYAFVALGLDLSPGCESENDFIAALHNLIDLVGESEIAALETAGYLPSEITVELVGQCVGRRVVLDITLDISKDPVANEFFVYDGRAKRRLMIFHPTSTLSRATRGPLVEACARRLFRIKTDDAARNASRDYRLGETIMFRVGEDSARFLVSGWARFERYFVWATGKVSRMEIRVHPEELTDDALVVMLECMAFVAPKKLPSQRLSVLVNGKRAFKGRLNGRTTFSFSVDRRLIDGSGALRIVFIHPDRARPVDISPGLSQDRRELSLALYSLVLKQPPRGGI